jgi:hypothetical protein
MSDVRGTRTVAELSWLDWLGERLAEATGALISAAEEGHEAETVSHLLFYAPQVLDSSAPELRRANMPTGYRATIMMRERDNQDENPVWGERRRA